MYLILSLSLAWLQVSVYDEAHVAYLRALRKKILPAVRMCFVRCANVAAVRRIHPRVLPLYKQKHFTHRKIRDELFFFQSRLDYD